MKKLLVICLVMCGIALGHTLAQERCATMDVLEEKKAQNPEIEKLMEDVEQFIQRNQHLNTGMRNTVATIPVVVHVVWKRQNQNVSDAQIQTQIDVLNEDFRRLNADASNTPSGFLGVAADSEIEFCLASVDPNGNATTGITRTKTRKASFSYINDGVKFDATDGKNAWPYTDYLNLWVCNLGNSLLGYAQFPNGGPGNTDGVVIDYAYFGTTGTATAPYNLGRTATHEVGHWLNLYHVWGDGPGCSSGTASLSCSCSYDDLVGDTPNHGRANYGCVTGQVSCGSTDMPENYMDYSYDNCMNLFTTGQKNRMRTLFNSGGFRESLLSSGGCNAPVSCNTPGNLSISNIVNTTANASWNAAANAVSYNVQIRPTGGTWSSSNTTGTTYNFTGLAVCTGYEVQVQTVCASGSSNYSSSQNFTTTGCTGGTCNTPTGISSTVISSRKASISWNTVTGAISYEVQYREVGASTWKLKTTSSTSVTLNGLKPGRTYEYRVRAICSGGNSPWSSIGTFTTSGGNRELLVELTIFPKS